MKRQFVLLGVVSFFWVLLSCSSDKEEPTVASNDVQVLDFDTMWDYGDPASTRARFTEILPAAEEKGGPSYHLQLLTQIARTHGLEANFDSAHAILDSVNQQLTDELPLVNVRYLLERGRTYRSAGDADKALPMFVEAFEKSRSLGADFFTIDAAHMVAIAETEPEKKRSWNLVGCEIAEASSDPRARNWRGSLYNNMGWDLHESGQYDKALEMFQKALVAREEQGNEENFAIARWCIARCYRSLGRVDEALDIQRALLAKQTESGNEDGYVHEELGELILLTGSESEATAHFAKAYELLSQDTWLQRNETERLERLRTLGKVEK